MDRPGLRLVERRAAPGAASVLATLAVAIVVVGCAVLATASGAALARDDVDVRSVARQALDRALVEGSDDPQVRATLIDLRRAVRDRPLDAGRRVAYAALLLGLSGHVAETDAAAFHADLAARLAPVTVPVVRSAAQVLARGGHQAEALDLTRRMFDYDPDAAADLLARLEPVIWSEPLERGLAERPAAWLAWARRIADDGRGDESRRLLAEAVRRWPDDPGVLRQLAAQAVRRRAWDDVLALAPPDADLPASATGSELRVYRGQARCATGDLAGGLEDLSGAPAPKDGSAFFRMVRGDALQTCGREDEARVQWLRALHSADDQAPAIRVGLRLRLARLEERRGEASTALRHWRAVLDLEPDNAEARERIGLLGGVLPSRSR